LDDLWLDKIQQPSQVELLLDAFATRSGLLPKVASRVRDPEALPERLKLFARDDTHVWVCFSCGSQFWLFTGMLSVSLSQERDTPVLWMNAYSEDGALIEIGACTVNHDGNWRRLR
jgi:hypothetical protein